MCNDNKEWCKIWKGIDLPVQNWHEKFNKVWTEDSKIWKICILLGYFWPKSVMFELRKYRGVVWWHTRLIKSLKENWLVLLKMTWSIWKCFTRALENLRIETLMTSLCLKLKMYELKIYRRVMRHDNEEWSKNWGGIDLSVQNWHEEFDEFWPKH